MSNEIILQQATPLGTPAVQQTGSNNVNINNQEGGTVNIHYHLPLQETSSNTEMIMAIQQFSKEYYQLIVTAEAETFENDTVTVSTQRALCQNLVPPEIFDRCSTLSEEGIRELMTFPAIICRENTELGGITDPNQTAIYAFIKRIMKVGKNIRIAFQPIMPLYQIKLCDRRNAIFFDLNMGCAVTDLNRSAWSVHKVNLFTAFDEAGIVNMPRPV